MRLFSLHTLAATFMILTGCNSLMALVNDIFPNVSGEPAATVVEVTSSNDVLAAIYENLDAANAEDIEGYMATVHPDSPYYVSTRPTMENLFATYDLYFNLIEVEIIEQTETEARVRYIQETTRLGGAPFDDIRVTGVYIMRLDGDEWKFYDQTLETRDYINE